MSVRNWLVRVGKAITGEYERRIRAASQVTEYGAGHGHDDHATTPHASTSNEQHDNDSGDGAAITNVPPGTQVGGSRRSRSR